MLDPVVLASIADLEIVARVTVEGTITGLHRSPFHGYSAEFSQYRHYRPGDDLKYVDWKLFARTDRIYTKQYRETTNMASVVVLDASASMAYRGRTGIGKLEYARLVAAALAYLAAAQGDGVGLLVNRGEGVEYLAPKGGQAHLRSLWAALARVQAAGETAIAAACRRGAELLKRRGHLVVISDLYEESEAMDAELRRAAGMGHDVSIFQILTRDEAELPIDGAVEFVDSESRAVFFTDAGRARDAYLRRFGEFLDRWESRCARYGIEYTRVLTDMPVDSALRGYVARRTGAAAR